MIHVNQLTFGFPQKDLYTDVTFTLEPGDHNHCAFIGSSGSGKSTLISLILDTIEPQKYVFEGHIDIDKHCRIGYVQQFSQAEADDQASVFAYIAQPFIEMHDAIDLVCEKMASATEADLEDLLIDYQLKLDRFSAIDAENYEANINKKLNLANLYKFRDLSVKNLSGGEFKLIQVIKEMLNRPELLIMDEPDVFLDFENLIALKELINSYDGMLLVITHNRFLLNHCFNKIIHLENKRLQEFDGTYSDYHFSLLAAKVDLLEKSQADEEAIEKNEALIEKLRFHATYNSEASRGKALRARVKHQERLIARSIKMPFVTIQEPHIEFNTDRPLEDTALVLDHYSAAFEDVLLENVCIEIGATDKVALLGSNGSGKTTLLRDIARGNHPQIKVNPNAKIAYLSQHQGESLNLNNTLIDEFYDLGINSTSRIKSFLDEFGFNEESVNQKIASLSGGEKNILQLAKLSAQKANVLLLDEPTSHLDTYGQIALEKAIDQYRGAIFMISHDYYTIANCMDYVMMIEGQTIRKISMKKFKRMVYADHFDRDYIAYEEKKKLLETDIARCLSRKDFETAKEILADLEAHLAQS